MSEELVKAAAKGNINKIKECISKDDIHYKDDLPLRTALWHKQFKAVKLLLDLKANVNAYNDAALRWAVKYKYNTNIIKLLLDYNANVHVSDDFLLRYAATDGQYNTVKLLLEYKANVHANDDEALYLACKYGYDNIVKLLLDYGANISANDNEPLKIAIKYNHYKVVKILIQYGLDNSVKSQLKTWAKENDYTEILELINTNIIQSLFNIQEKNVRRTYPSSNK